MRFPLAFLCLAAALAAPGALLAREIKRTRTTYPVTYEGGNLPLSHKKVKASFDSDDVVLAQRRHRIAVPLRDITEISCRNEIHRRLGAAVLSTVPRLRLGEAGTYYVGVTWTDDRRTGDGAAKVEAIFRVNGGDYREFLASLERMTGKKAVDTSHVPTAVRYAL